MNPLAPLKDMCMSRTFLIPMLALLIAGCGSETHQGKDGHDQAAAPVTDDHAGHDHHDHDHDHGSEGVALTATVRENLGITFVKAEYRVVQGLLRFPGRFEAEPSARRAYQMPLPGQVEVLVKPYQRIAAGDPLYRIASIGWHSLQRELAEATVAAQLIGERYTAAQAHARVLDQAVGLWNQRAAVLERLAEEVGGKAGELAEAKGRLVDLLVQQAAARTRLAELKYEAVGADGTAEGGLAAIRRRQALATAARITGIDAVMLMGEVDGRPRWQGIDEPVIAARMAGVVEGEVATSGTWLDERATVLTVTNPAGVHLRASALQADLDKLRDGLPARIVGVDPHDPLRLPALVVLAPIASAVDRSLELIARPMSDATIPGAIRPGIAAVLEVAVSGSGDEELAIPVAATIRDGLKIIFFKRDRNTPDVVEKVEADLGASDGRWVVVNSGLKEGDEVVVGGLYPLKLSQQDGGGAEAGHFEADGTFHTGKH
jgi:hypothetical protein